LKGDVDLSLDIDLLQNNQDDVYFKDDQVQIRFTEIVGGFCGDPDAACKVYDYGD